MGSLKNFKAIQMTFKSLLIYVCIIWHMRYKMAFFFLKKKKKIQNLTIIFVSFLKQIAFLML
jgi:hypothetical protein